MKCTYMGFAEMYKLSLSFNKFCSLSSNPLYNNIKL